MKPKTVYLLLSVAGVAIPYGAFAPWIAAHGLNIRLFCTELLANRICMFFVLDVVVSAVGLCTFVGFERRRQTVRSPWIFVVPALLLVGVSLALPLFLWLREQAQTAVRDTASSPRA
jgi:hypothetical protein